jgi:hypothetical protein
MGFSVTTQLDVAICDFKFSIRHFDLPNTCSAKCAGLLVKTHNKGGARSAY